MTYASLTRQFIALDTAVSMIREATASDITSGALTVYDGPTFNYTDPKDLIIVGCDNLDGITTMYTNGTMTGAQTWMTIGSDFMSGNRKSETFGIPCVLRVYDGSTNSEQAMADGDVFSQLRLKADGYFGKIETLWRANIDNVRMRGVAALNTNLAVGDIRQRTDNSGSIVAVRFTIAVNARI